MKLYPDGDTYDYIVVGAGASGATAASRLALAGKNVLLVEAGGDPNILTKIPLAAMFLLGSNMDWKYKTISNNVSCLSSIDQQCRFSRGKCLGGSTSINYMIYTRGNRIMDFRDITVPNWSYDDLLPYFLRFEGLQSLDKLPSSSAEYHNTTGIMKLEFFNDSLNPWHSRLIDAFISLGFPLNYDVNAKSQIGVSQVVGYVYDGERMSTARAYLSNSDVKAKLNVAKGTKCTGVIIDDNNIASGITVSQGSNNLRIYARKEVILSAGTIGTPQILMLSGIGPADHLNSMGIPVKVDLPVGESMVDHALPLLILQVGESTNNISIYLRILNFLSTTASVLSAITLRLFSGNLFSSNGLSDIIAFINTQCYDFEQRRLLNVSADGSDCEVPNIEILGAYVEKTLISLAEPIFQQVTGFNDKVIQQLSAANKHSALITVSPALLMPKSKGYVQLASTDPLAAPAIFPNFLSDEADVEEMVSAITIIEHLVDTFSEQNVKLLHLEFDGCPSYSEDSAEYWRCYTRHMTFTIYHAAGTSALGTVVDEYLRVNGVQRLRVADLSVLPYMPRSNTAAVTVAIGERVVDFLLEDNQ